MVDLIETDLLPTNGFQSAVWKTDTVKNSGHRPDLLGLTPSSGHLFMECLLGVWADYLFELCLNALICKMD